MLFGTTLVIPGASITPQPTLTSAIELPFQIEDDTGDNNDDETNDEDDDEDNDDETDDEDDDDETNDEDDDDGTNDEDDDDETDDEDDDDETDDEDNDDETDDEDNDDETDDDDEQEKIKFTPPVINLKSHGKWVTIHVWHYIGELNIEASFALVLYKVKEDDSLEEIDSLNAEQANMKDSNIVLTFSRSAIISKISNQGEYTVKLKNGDQFLSEPEYGELSVTFIVFNPPRALGRNNM
jgi:hypothetical protein